MDIFVSAEINKAKRLIYKHNLLPINNLKLIFREIRDYFAGNVTGITRDEKIAQNIMRLLFCKIYDEKYTENEQLVDFANRPNEKLTDFQKRLFDLFEKVKNQYADIFEKEEELEIQAFDLSFIVSTTDIVNWEIKINSVKSVAEEIYWQYKKQQDIRENDILLVNDGTFLIGRSAIVTDLDTRCIIQSHLRKIRVLKPEELNPFYLFYLLNSKIVQQQIEMLTFVQATLSTLGNRILDLQLPIHKNQTEAQTLAQEVHNIISLKKELKKRTNSLIDNSL